MTKMNKKIAVVGAGHNALICATYLAKSGFTVDVFESRSQIGGMIGSRKLGDEYSVPGAAHLLHHIDESVFKKLNLQKYGLEYSAKDLKTISLNPDGNALVINGDEVDGDDITMKEKNEFRALKKRMDKLAGFLESTYAKKPPRLGSNDRDDLLSLMSLGLNVRMMGKDSMSDLLKFIAVNIYDVLNELTDHDHLKGTLAFDGVLGNHMGPRTNNSVITYLHQLTGGIDGKKGSHAMVSGGTDSFTNSLEEAAKAAGVNIHLNASVESISFTDDLKITGLNLKNGDHFDAEIIVSGIDPRSTFNCLVGPKKLEAGVVHKVNNVRMRGNVAKLHLALSSKPKFKGISEDDLGERIVYSPSMEYLEKTFDYNKYGKISNDLPMEITIPSVHDKTLAPKGHHVLSAIVNYVPYHLKEGWENSKSRILEQCINQLDGLAPGLKGLVVESELLTPVDIEKEYGITGGQWHHGELTFDQFLMLRPVPKMAQYQSPISSLYLCGAGSHPGGGIMGTAGKNAAIEIMKRES
jgi:phytoene dehydrogenase-like protein